MFMLALTAGDREVINELANRYNVIDRVREHLTNTDELNELWMGDATVNFPINQTDLETYLSVVHNIYITTK